MRKILRVLALGAVVLSGPWLGVPAAHSAQLPTSATVTTIPQAVTACTIRAKVWYDSDQYGTYPKAWGEVSGCHGPVFLRTTISCGTTIKVNDTANAASWSATGVKTTPRFIGWCPNKTWSATLSGSQGGAAFTKHFHWKDWGYPV